ncbi:hypothetical protein F5878DRAFT_547044 [Lentinula raphanica]|uniref:DUF202 domain-containing protein n=1 Tax=Lentinula raphanica TaxID=153919 RepID=A0AA38NYV2_9AGAR|nr:hypothetical protein C8R42DRAFT_573054 [Lentinula raphanica]KAJ3758976.1 hypothetical protein EV360DRAFT_42805 [Lentinula raphanica]KAJ3828700.1 hypothetical protein F5880DRAFT_1472024 [Lentinula raphanica]KAJ3833154.1 hypothetical protein F5878DRAFT_547044 [Lentinula raphanica]
MASHRHVLSGHRAQSFFASDLNELVEIRARQRTFYGAYFRTALGNLGYALTILRLFDSRFYRIGLLFTILGALLFVLSFLRDRHSRHDFADPRGRALYGSYEPEDIIQTVGQKGTRIFGRPFVTAGWIVISVAFVVFAVEIGLLVLILKL